MNKAPLILKVLGYPIVKLYPKNFKNVVTTYSFNESSKNKSNSNLNLKELAKQAGIYISVLLLLNLMLVILLQLLSLNTLFFSFLDYRALYLPSNI